MGRSIDVYSSYGIAGASTRVRILSWLDHFGLVPGDHFRFFSHIGESNSKPMTIMSNWQKLASAEIQLRTSTKGADCDVAFVSRRASPFSNGRAEEVILQSAGLGIYDFDDAIYDLTSSSIPKVLWNPKRTWKRSILASDVTIAANDFLAEDASTLSSRVEVIPSLINPSEYIQKKTFHIQNERIILWLGSASTAHNLELLVKPLDSLNKSMRARVLAVGAPSSAERVLGPNFKILPWSLEAVRDLSSVADVGVMPLRNTFFNARKSGYKMLQYAAMGLPSIGSPVGASASILEALGSLKAVSSEDWESLLQDLLSTSAERDRSTIGQRQRQAVVENFSYKAWEERFSSVTSISRP